MPELPLYPEPGKDAPGYALERRRKSLAGVPPETLASALRDLRIDVVTETLGLTGAPVARDLVVRVAAGGEAAGGEAAGGEQARHARGVLDALALIEREASRRSEPDLELVVEVHRTAHPGVDGELRRSDRGSQFAGARPSDPRFVQPKLENLLEWLASESCRTMFPAERMALWFARFVEIAPFERGNFRTGHLLASHFSLATGFPPVALRLEDAEAIRADLERAVRFDTLPLVERFSGALSRGLETLEAASAGPGRETEGDGSS